MRPVIGVLPLYNANNQTFWMNPLYMLGVEAAGGVPLLLELSESESIWEEYCQRLDGFVFPGGQDVAPGLYGQVPLPACNYQAPLRDSQEAWMLRRLRALDKPVLGICRGIQIMNAVFGGTLFQDLPSQRPSPVTHLQQKPFEVPCHQVEIRPGSRLSGLIGHRYLSVNSVHHQAVDRPAPEFLVSAWAEDGLIEAIELPEARFFLGVQWHPEHMWRDYPSGRALWRGLVDACKQNPN